MNDYRRLIARNPANPWLAGFVNRLGVREQTVPSLSNAAKTQGRRRNVSQAVPSSHL